MNSYWSTKQTNGKGIAISNIKLTLLQKKKQNKNPPPKKKKKTNQNGRGDSFMYVPKNELSTDKQWKYNTIVLIFKYPRLSKHWTIVIMKIENIYRFKKETRRTCI